MKALVVGSGIAGLCMAYQLSKHGYEVDIYGKNEAINRASSLAQGIICNKGLLKAYSLLFSYKLASLSYIKNFIKTLETESGMIIESNFSGVYECFDDDFNSTMKRVYKGNYTGLFRNKCKHLGESFQDYIYSKNNVIMEYPEEGWFNVESFLNALESILINKFNQNIFRKHLSNDEIKNLETSYDLRIICSGYKTKEIIESISDVKLNLKPVSGQTLNFSTSKDLKINIVKGTNSIIWSGNRIYVGSTSIKDDCPSKEVLQSEFDKLDKYTKSYIKADLKLESNFDNYGVRALYKGRNPVWGYVEDEKLLFFTGLFKNGLQLGPILSESIINSLIKGTEFTDFKLKSV